MFKKRECNRCRRKIEEKYSFCPYCGNKFESNEGDNGDWGMLGKDDFMPSLNEIKLPMGLNAIFNSLMKNMSKELNEQLGKNSFPVPEKQPKNTKKNGLSISISTFGNGPPKIKVTQMGGNPVPKKQEEIKEKIKQNPFTKEKVKKFSELKKEEPRTNIRRLSNGVVYELEMPDVKSLEDVSIIKLENSIEIKALSKKKAYVKVIPINLPITNYNLSEGKLILELGIKN